MSNQRDIFNLTTMEARELLGGSFHELHCIATIEITKVERQLQEAYKTIEELKKNQS